MTYDDTPEITEIYYEIPDNEVISKSEIKIMIQ